MSGGTGISACCRRSSAPRSSMAVAARRDSAVSNPASVSKQPTNHEHSACAYRLTSIYRAACLQRPAASCSVQVHLSADTTSPSDDTYSPLNVLSATLNRCQAQSDHSRRGTGLTSAGSLAIESSSVNRSSELQSQSQHTPKRRCTPRAPSESLARNGSLTTSPPAAAA